MRFSEARNPKPQHRRYHVTERCDICTNAGAVRVTEETRDRYYALAAWVKLACPRCLSRCKTRSMPQRQREAA
jgi:hypothetical protein